MLVRRDELRASAIMAKRLKSNKKIVSNQLAMIKKDLIDIEIDYSMEYYRDRNLGRWRFTKRLAYQERKDRGRIDPTYKWPILCNWHVGELLI